MALKRLSAWFLTDQGKKFSYLFAGTVSTGALLANFLPHTIFLDKYQNILHLYKKGFSVPLTPKLQDRFQKALELAEVLIDESDRHLFKPFAIYGFDVFSIGTSYSQYGVAVGLPANFFYDDEASVDKSAIKIRDDSIRWDLDEGKLLLKSLVLSENAQLYAMAREIKFRGTPKIMIDTAVSVLSCIGMYGLCNTLNIRLNLYARPLGLRLVMYSIVGALAVGNYALVKDCSQVYYENKIDSELRKKSPIFVEGGKEFYSKLLERNKALRKLLGKEGERAYSVMGNENYFIRYKHIPLVQRRSAFDENVETA